MRCGCQPSRAPPPCRASHDDHRDRALHGCRQFDAHQGIDNPDEFAFVERYESQAAFAEHRRTPHFRRNVETELVALLTARSWTVFGPAL